MPFIKPKKPIIAIVLTAAVLLGGLAYLKRQDIRDMIFRAEQGPIPAPISKEDFVKTTTEPTPAVHVNSNTNAAKPNSPTPPPAPKPTPPTDAPSAALPDSPTSLNLSVIFIPQAPLLVWDRMHEETCEESSMAMVKAYIDGRKTMTLQEMEKELQAIVDYEMRTLGYFESTDSPTTVQVMKDFYGLSTAKVVVLNSIEDVKKEIAKGHPVMLPTAGRLLGNPNFKSPGPIYHMVVAKGYTPTRIITNDPGTRKGADYTYSYDVLWKSIAEWNGHGMDTSKKLMIIVE